MIFFNLVLQTIEGFKAFTQAFIVSGGTGGPIDSTLFYSLYLYEEAFANFRMGYASALGLAPARHHRDLHRHRLRHLEILGLLRGRGPVNRKPTLGQELFRHALLIAASVVMLYPLLWMIASSFKPDELDLLQPDRAARLARSHQLRRGLDGAPGVVHHLLSATASSSPAWR